MRKQPRVEFATAHCVVSSEAEARMVVGLLITASQWLEVTPLPDDQWRLAVKAENRRMLRASAAAALGAK